MSAAIKPTQLYVFLRHHLGKHALGALTGQDTAGLLAFAALLQFYCFSDDSGRRSALASMRLVLDGVQESVWPIFRKTIPFVLDWSDETTLWERLFAEAGS